MARLPNVDAGTPGVDADLVRAVRERRGGELLNLDRMLLHSAPVARGWNGYMGAIRTGCELAGDLRELVILQVAVLNRAPYEFAQHVPVALADGLSQRKIDALVDWRTASVFSERERDVLAYAEAMTLKVQVDEAIFNAVRRHFSDREVVELTATVASYNMVSRFLEALGVQIEAQ
jgi:alkylhydroperoxidase family enzyme